MKEIKESASGTGCAQMSGANNFLDFFYFCGTKKIIREIRFNSLS